MKDMSENSEVTVSETFQSGMHRATLTLMTTTSLVCAKGLSLLINRLHYTTLTPVTFSNNSNKFIPDINKFWQHSELTGLTAPSCYDSTLGKGNLSPVPTPIVPCAVQNFP